MFMTHLLLSQHSDKNERSHEIVYMMIHYYIFMQLNSVLSVYIVLRYQQLTFFCNRLFTNFAFLNVRYLFLQSLDTPIAYIVLFSSFSVIRSCHSSSFVIFLLAIVLSVLRFTDSYYPLWCLQTLRLFFLYCYKLKRNPFSFRSK